MSIRRRNIFLAIPAAVAVALIAGATSIALSVPSRPPIVATVDLEQLFNGLENQDAETARIDKIAKDVAALPATPLIRATQVQSIDKIAIDAVDHVLIKG